MTASLRAEERGATGSTDSEHERGHGAHERPRHRALTLAATLALHGLVAWLYLWFATAGTYGFSHREYADYYDLLARGFLAGQLHLPVEPSPRLLALANPYDPAQNAPYRLRDAALYDGKYYLYWGPVPGLVHAAWTAISGRPLGDGSACLLFGLVGCLLFWLLARTLRDLAAPRAPDALLGLVYACYALGGVSLYLQVRADVYKEAILAGTCFTLVGLHFWLRALAGRGPAGPQLALAGLFCGLGFGSRLTMLGYALGAGLVLLWPWIKAPRRAATLRPVLQFGLPAAVVLLALLLYNQARFGSLAEFGHRYQLMSIANGQHTLAGGMHPDFAPLNLAVYLALSPAMLPWFPLLEFVNPPLTLVDVGPFRWARDTFSVPLPHLAPLALLAPLAPLLALRATHQSSPAARAFVAAATIGLVLNVAVLLLYIAAAMRYLQDFLPFALLLGGLVLWRAWPPPERRGWRRAIATFSGAIMAVSLALALGFALNHLGRVEAEPYLRLAYRFDQVADGALRLVAPGAWPEWYGTTAGRRLFGAYYPEGAPLPLQASPGSRPRELVLWSLFPSDTPLTVTIDGARVFEGRLRPGQQRLRLSPAPTIGATGRSAVELRFPGEAARPPGSLWPVAVVALE